MKVAQFFISFFLTCHASQTSNSELLALKGLFAVTGGLNGSWVNSSGWDNHGSIDPCGWYGVVCNSTTSNSTTRVNVAGLFLSTNGLKGVIPSSHLTELSLLGHLDLSKNSFTGALPSDICALGSSLRYLGFWGNSLIGRCIDTLLQHVMFISIPDHASDPILLAFQARFPHATATRSQI